MHHSVKIMKLLFLVIYLFIGIHRIRQYVAIGNRSLFAYPRVHNQSDRFCKLYSQVHIEARIRGFQSNETTFCLSNIDAFLEVASDEIYACSILPNNSTAHLEVKIFE